MKNTFIVIILLLQSLQVFSQDKENLHILEADSTWLKEIIKFPLGFAKEITFEGYEDIRFPEGWSKQDSPNFWSYVFAWNISGNIKPTELMLEHNMQFYFDGLMGIGPNSFNTQSKNGSTAIFIKSKNPGNAPEYIGKIKTIDTRFTNKAMTLNVRVEVYYCEQKNNTIILFRFSPKAFEDEIWEILDKVK